MPHRTGGMREVNDMKLIHCADLHLDSAMSANLDPKKADERRVELLDTFRRMVEYADKQDVCAILIAGDLFDRGCIQDTTRHVVEELIRNHSHILFFYLKGNHDKDNFLMDAESVPENLKLFTDEWREYPQGEVSIYGMEMTGRNVKGAASSLKIDRGRINIVMLHGQVEESRSEREAEIIPLGAFCGRGIDYLALGHVHEYRDGQLDSRGVYVYPGCLEGRGFDECGEKGFVLLETDEVRKTCRHSFVPFAKRRIYTLPVNVSGADTTAQVVQRIEEALGEKPDTAGGKPDTAGAAVRLPERDDIIKIVLCGSRRADGERNMDYIRACFAGRYYFVKISDLTSIEADADEYAGDESLKGEFVRMVTAAEGLDKDDKAQIIRFGLGALSGKEPEREWES